MHNEFFPGGDFGGRQQYGRGVPAVSPGGDFNQPYGSSSSSMLLSSGSSDIPADASSFMLGPGPPIVTGESGT